MHKQQIAKIADPRQFSESLMTSASKTGHAPFNKIK